MRLRRGVTRNKFATLIMFSKIRKVKSKESSKLQEPKTVAFEFLGKGQIFPLKSGSVPSEPKKILTLTKSGEKFSPFWYGE